MEDYLKGKVLIKRNGEAIRHFLDKENDEWKSGIIDPIHILFHLHEPIVIEEGFTLRNYFNFIECYPHFRLIDGFFDCYLEEYQNLITNCYDSDKEIDYLSLNRVMSYEEHRQISLEGIEEILPETDDKEGIEVSEHIQYFISFNGMGKDGTTSYSIMFSPLKELLDHEIKIDKAIISIELPGEIEDYENLQDKYVTRRAKDNNFTLYEFMKGIIWELSFCGCPESKEQKLKELEDNIDDLEQ